MRYYHYAFCFIALCLFMYYVASVKKKDVIASLDEHLQNLRAEQMLLLQEKQDLLLQIDSQKDPRWIKLILMKGLGLVPEGQLKVYFHGDEG